MQLGNLVGKIFKRLKVLRIIRTRRGERVYSCKCVCGKITEVSEGSLLSGRSGSCGCFRRELQRTLHYLRPYEHLYRHLLRQAKKRKHRVSITYTAFLRFTKVLRCHYCWADIQWVSHNQHGGSLRYNLDRADNKYGYTLKNCVVCCPRCNQGKSNSFTYDEWWKMTECFRKEKSYA